MKKIIVIIGLSILSILSFPQTQKIDTNYATAVVSADWMPDGRSMLIAVVKYHKTNPGFTSKVFRYELNSKQLIYLFDNAGNLAPSPGGKTIAFLRRDDKIRSDIYFYNVETKNETVFKTDTLKKNALSWSPDGKKLIYNAGYPDKKDHSKVEVCVVDIAAKKTKRITHSGKNKSYSPEWCPDSKRIVYYLEKDDGRDQIWLTDLNGSFHTNLTNDTTTHNYFPGWLDEKTIFYIQSPETLMFMNTDGSKRTKVDGIKGQQPKYNAVNGLFVYEADNTIVLYDWKKKTATVILDGAKMIEHY